MQELHTLVKMSKKSGKRNISQNGRMDQITIEKTSCRLEQGVGEKGKPKKDLVKMKNLWGRMGQGGFETAAEMDKKTWSNAIGRRQKRKTQLTGFSKRLVSEGTEMGRCRPARNGAPAVPSCGTQGWARSLWRNRVNLYSSHNRQQMGNRGSSFGGVGGLGLDRSDSKTHPRNEQNQSRS